MINKKNLWFLTLFSLVLVLSIYYVTMPNEIFDKNIKETTTDNSTTKVEETSIISALKVEDDNNVMDKINSLKEKLTSTDISTEEKNSVFEELKLLNKNSSKEETIELKIKEYILFYYISFNVVMLIMLYKYEGIYRYYKIS